MAVNKVWSDTFHCMLYNISFTHSLSSLKLSSIPVSPSMKEMQTFYNEVEILKKLSMLCNPHVITMVGYIARENPPAIVMEFAPLGSLRDFLVKVKNEVRLSVSLTQTIYVSCVRSGHGREHGSFLFRACMFIPWPILYSAAF